MCPIESHQTLHRCIFLSPGSRAPQSLAVPPAARAPPSILFCFDLPAKVSSLEYLETAVEPDTAGVLFVRSAPEVISPRRPRPRRLRKSFGCAARHSSRPHIAYEIPRADLGWSLPSRENRSDAPGHDA